jgi:hypothetical protein
MSQKRHLEVLFNRDRYLKSNTETVMARFPHLRGMTSTRYFYIMESMLSEFSEEDKQFLDYCIETMILQQWRCEQA